MVFGGRSSPLNPVSGLVRLTIESCTSHNPIEPKDGYSVRLCVETMMCTGDQPSARWRHAAAVVSHSGEMQTQICGSVIQESSSAITLLVLTQSLQRSLSLQVKTSCLFLVGSINLVRF